MKLVISFIEKSLCFMPHLDGEEMSLCLCFESEQQN